VQIDWFTTIAQIVNFLILVVLLHRFLYGPIVRLTDKREELIASRLREAGKKEEEAARESRSFRDKQRELESQRDDLIHQAEEEAQTRRRQLMEEARQDVRDARERWRSGLTHDQRSFLRELRQRAAEETVGIARRALADLADEELENRIVAVFINLLGDMTEEHLALVADSIRDTGGQVTVRSAFPLSEGRRGDIMDALKDHLVGEDAPRAGFTVSSQLVCGIELIVDGHRLGWSIDHYLESFEESLRDKLEEETRKELGGE
jgi:F-type H+-transporting ATPase subunit b